MFVFVEGEEGVGERERFRNLAGLPQNVRFMECGSCNEVLRRVASIKALATEAEAGIRIGGVVDRDFRSNADANALSNDNGVLVLAVHEVENFFLHPATLGVLLQQNGRAHIEAAALIREAADARAGSWIFQHAMTTPNAKSLPELPVAAKEEAKRLTWAQFEDDQNSVIERIVGAAGYGEDDRDKLASILNISRKSYERKRAGDDLWKVCEGKQVLNDVARAVGFVDAPALVQAAFAFWRRDGGQLPEELKAFQEYLAGL
ncbi:MAG: DUF4435 domain-containing protein [Rhodoplanes sp.]